MKNLGINLEMLTRDFLFTKFPNRGLVAMLRLRIFFGGESLE